MSNSIWKTPDQKPDYNKYIIFMVDDSPLVGCFDEYTQRFYDLRRADILYNTDNIDCWTYLKDILAQADKAERLEKAVDYALQVLDNVSEIGGIDLEIAKIKQLIKGE